MKMLSLLPECTWILVIVGVGFALMLQIISRQTAGRIIGTIVLLALLSPFVDSLFDTLPGWVSLLLLIGFCFSVGNWIIGALFGRHTASHLWALLLHDVILIPFRLVGHLFRRR
jgi:predicted MFS family arabinose efflux permease